MDLEPGILITPKLRLKTQLGQGGMGSVWLADHLGLDSEVAVKFLAAEIAGRDATMLKRFKAEATLAARLRSPHVVQVFDHGVWNERRPFIVMERMEGEDLGQRLKRLGPLPTADVATVLEQSGKALEKAHSLGIVHRDLKPENLFNVDGGYGIFVKVLDFGIAKETHAGERLTTAFDVAGTPEFMSPEQLRSTMNVDHRSDLWAMGAVAYELLTGRVPFPARDLIELHQLLHAGSFIQISAAVPGAGPSLDAWFQRAFQVDPDLRFQSAIAMAQEFRLAIVNAPELRSTMAAEQIATPPRPSVGGGSMAAVTSPHITGAGVPAAQRSRRKWAVAIVVVAVVGVATASGVAAMRMHASSDTTRASNETEAVAQGGDSSAEAEVDLEPVASAPDVDVAPLDVVPPENEPSASPLVATGPTPLASSRKPAPPAQGPGRPADPPPSLDAPQTSVPSSIPTIPPQTPKPPPTKVAPDCKGNGAFILNGAGDLVPRPECIK